MDSLLQYPKKYKTFQVQKNDGLNSTVLNSGLVKEVKLTWNWALAGLFFFSFSAATSRNIFIAVSFFLPIV